MNLYRKSSLTTDQQQNTRWWILSPAEHHIWYPLFEEILLLCLCKKWVSVCQKTTSAPSMSAPAGPRGGESVWTHVETSARGSLPRPQRRSSQPAALVAFLQSSFAVCPFVLSIETSQVPIYLYATPLMPFGRWNPFPHSQWTYFWNIKEYDHLYLTETNLYTSLHWSMTPWGICISLPFSFFYWWN